MKLRQHCESDARRQAVLDSSKDMGGGLELNGIDFLEVLDLDAPTEELRQRLIDLTFLKTDGVTQEGDPVLGIDNFVIEGGTRVRDIRIEKVETGADASTLRLTLDRAGDFSRYALRLRGAVDNEDPPPNMDPVLSCVRFWFKAECATGFDCRPSPRPAGPADPGPQLDYLVKDYESFRRLMLDRMASTIPAWTERSPADLGVTLVETLAYAADHTSYYQDAVATESYLPLARLRTSVRRHARLLGYRVHEGCNARAFVVIIAAQNSAPPNGAVFRKGTRLITRPANPPSSLKKAISQAEFDKLRNTGVVVFETMEDLREIRTKRNAIPFHTWGEQQCCLPRGTTSAYLVGTAAELGLSKGDVLVLEELIPTGGIAADPADPTHRQAVRLSADPIELTDPLDDTAVLEIWWHEGDALGFPLNLSGDGGTPGAVAHANVVLADHGERVASELMPPEPESGRTYRPRLTATGITHAVPHDPEHAREQSAVATLRTEAMQALPVVTLFGGGDTWTPIHDLLGSDRFAPEFVVETTDDGSASLRFGDDDFGRHPGDTQFSVAVRLGNGPEGNIGADSLAHVVTNDPDVVKEVRNPLPAEGGAAPESSTTVKINAPRAFRRQRRAVTPDDYARAIESHAMVQHAVADRRWTGSWHTMFITVDRIGGGPVSRELEVELRESIASHRLAGHDVEIEPPEEVPLDIALLVCVQRGHYAANVHRSLLEVFGTGELADGTRGFFHPENFSFGTPVLLSHMIARAMAVDGVRWVGLALDGADELGRFRRLRDQAVDYGAGGIITIGRREIARLDNDPNAPENGRLRFIMEGGR